MTSLELAREGRNAARQIRAQMKAGVLMQDELDRLLKKVEAGFDQMMGPHFLDPAFPALRIIDGGRA